MCIRDSSYIDPKDATGGTTYYTKALSIANQGASSSFAVGWAKGDGTYDRQGIVTEILNEKFQNFRKAYFDYHYNGLDLYSEEPDEPIKMISKLISSVETIRAQIFSRSIFLKVFFDTKYIEMCEYLVKSKDQEIFERLKKVDPAHISTYDEYKKK
ncbi:MAG: DUF4835 family protein, partial [Ignavibacteria bacterium]|nr:DUF4835 family protein [Ignavibacteria bacterium]